MASSRTIAHRGGTTARAGERKLEIATGKLQSPEVTYTTTWWQLVITPDEVEIRFAQIVPFLNKIATLVCIQYSAEHARGMAERIRNGAFHQRLAEAAATIRGTDTPNPPPAAIEVVGDSLRVLYERAHFERMAYSGGDAEIEFFAVSPYVAHLVAQGMADAATRPIVAVCMPVGMLHDLASAILAWAKDTTVRAS